MRVIGIGNPLRGDDAAGLLVARHVRERRVPAVEVIELEGEPVGLLEAWEGAEAAIVVDAVRAGAAPGTVHVLDAGSTPLPPGVASASTHAMGLGDAIELARSLGRLPTELILVGIEATSFGVGAAPSPAVAAAVEPAAEAVIEAAQSSAATAAATRATGTR